jgi:hypothetical protein
MRRMLAVLLALSLAPACSYGPPPARAADAAAQASLVAEAQAFMASYAEDLIAGDRAAIAARYDRTGSWVVGNGRKMFSTAAATEAYYAGSGWSPPERFEWRDLSYEVTGPDSVVVVGTFVWKPKDGTPERIVSYTGLLIRQGGALRIRVEDESAQPLG